MNREERIRLTTQQLKEAIRDYGKYARSDESKSILSRCSSLFIDKLASESYRSKNDLRKLFAKCKGYDENMDAIVINANKDIQPDPDLIYSYAYDIMYPAINTLKISRSLFDSIMYFFQATNREFAEAFKNSTEKSLHTILAEFPNIFKNGKYDPNQKKSRIFKAICDEIGVTDDRKGSEFQSNFAKFADEVNIKRLPFKLYASINPCHFLTMSNPKCDTRGNMLTSCHSFNSQSYRFNNGCTGYATDPSTIIVFTTDDEKNKELLNNRKTTRQLFMYKPGNHVIMQSRLYTTEGGTHGEQETSITYREAIEKVISDAEGIPNLWNVYKATKNNLYNSIIDKNDYFGGYPDWEYDDFCAKIIVHRNTNIKDAEKIHVGHSGICIVCGERTSEGLYCSNHDFTSYYCEECHTMHNIRRDQMHTITDENGIMRTICDDCYNHQ